jgi:Lysyl oxidase
MRHRVAVGALVLVGLMGVGANGASGATPLVPDLEQLAADNVSVVSAPGGHYRLIFNSHVRARNNDPTYGPLIVRGHRATTSEPMVADQIIKNSDGSETVRRAIGQLYYEENPTHTHWHYKGFDRFQLRRVSDYAIATRDHKQGFCMPDPVFDTAYCASNKPNALFVQEGMSPGFIDTYHANVEGQYLDVTDVPAGQYYLINWVNADHSLLERGYEDDISALRIRLVPHPGTPPTLTVLRVLKPIYLPPTLSAKAAKRYVRRAITQYFHKRSQRLRQSCRRESESSFLCSVSWQQRSLRYRGKLRLVSVPIGTKQFERRYRLQVRRTNRECVSHHGRHCTKTIKSRLRRFRR